MMSKLEGAGEKWWRINEEENAVDYLEWAARFVVSDNPNRWKWVVIALHGALYGFAVCAIQGTDPDRVKTKDGKLISLQEALRRCQNSEYMLQFDQSKVLCLTDEEKDAIHRLSQNFRNRFVHFRPKLWFIEISGMPHIVSRVARVVHFLALESGNVWLTPEQRGRVGAALAYVQDNTSK